MTIRVAIAEESAFSADLVRFTLARAPDMRVISAGASAGEVEPLLYHSDILLVNHRLPDSGALRLLRTIDKSGLPTRVILRGGRVPPHDLIPYFELGVRGYLDAESSIDELFDVIRAAYIGEAIIPPQISAMLISRLAQLSQVRRAMLPDSGAALPGLTARQIEVLTLVARGNSNQEIAEQLFIEVGTVKNHIHNLLDKLNARDRHEAATLATRAGLITPLTPNSTDVGIERALLTTAV